MKNYSIFKNFQWLIMVFGVPFILIFFRGDGAFIEDLRVYIIIVFFLFVFRYSTYLIRMNETVMMIYSCFRLPKRVDLRAIDRVEFEGIEIRGRGVYLTLFMTIWSNNEKIWTSELLAIASRNFLKNVVRNASYCGYKVIFDDETKKMIVEESK